MCAKTVCQLGQARSTAVRNIDHSVVRVGDDDQGHTFWV
jgi:hypothetical protein